MQAAISSRNEHASLRRLHRAVVLCSALRRPHSSRCSLVHSKFSLHSHVLRFIIYAFYKRRQGTQLTSIAKAFRTKVQRWVGALAPLTVSSDHLDTGEYGQSDQVMLRLESYFNRCLFAPIFSAVRSSINFCFAMHVPHICSYRCPL